MLWVGIAVTLLALAAPASVAWAHEGAALEPHDVWQAWSWEPTLLFGLAVGGAANARGVSVLWRGAGPGRGVRAWQAGCFALGMLAMAVALVSPLDVLARVLLSAHMVQHQVLMLVAGPLLVLGAPALPLLWALPPRARRTLGRGWLRWTIPRRAWRLATAAPVAWVLHALAIWVWHAPALYQAALTSEPLHVAQHGSFLGTGLLYWWTLVHARRHGARASAIGLLSLFGMMLQHLLLATLLTFARAPWYPAYAATTAAWGLTPLDDQALAGSIMHASGMLTYLLAGLAMAASLFRASEREALAREGVVDGQRT